MKKETESKDIMKDQKRKQKLKLKLEVRGILKAAFTIPYKSINFIIFTVITSLPLLCFLIYFESFLVATISETAHILVPRSTYFNYDWLFQDYLRPTIFNKDFAYKLIQLFFLYLVPFHLLELFNVFLTIDLASKIYKEERAITLKEMLDTPMGMRKLRGTFITSIYVLFLSTCTLLGLIWLVINYCTMSIDFRYNGFYFFAVFYGGAFVSLLTKYLEWSAQWNMSIVISILEEIYGIDALVLSGYFNRGSEKRGRALMFVFFAFFVSGLISRLICLILGCYESGIGTILPILFTCFGNVIKWVACVVYFYDCKQKILDKKLDEEVGVVITAVDE